MTEATQVPPGTGVTDLAVVQGINNAGTPPDAGRERDVLPLRADGGRLDRAVHQRRDAGRSTKARSQLQPAPGKASATSDAVNTSASPLAPGRYCFRAVWPGDTNYTGSTHVGTEQSECFIVRQIATTTVTTPSNGLGVPLSSPVDLGTILFDKAVVTGTAAGGTAARHGRSSSSATRRR